MSIAPARPSRARATSALALVFAAGFASAVVVGSGWSPASGWFFGTVAVLLLLLLASWGGVHLTNILRRRIALRFRGHRGSAPALVAAKEPGQGEEGGGGADPGGPAAEERVAMLVRVSPPGGANAPVWLPLSQIAGYLDRYGVRCSAVRVAFRSSGEGREAWITLVIDARENLAALRARGSQIQLRELAEATRRRLAAQLREGGFAAEHAEAAPSPVLLGVEDWNGIVVDPSASHAEAGAEDRVAAYRVSAGDGLDERLAAIAAYPAKEIWTVLEFTGQPCAPELAVACALRKQGIVALLPEGLRPQRGAHLPALAALAPSSTALLVAS